LARGHPLALELCSRQRSIPFASVDGVGKELAALDLSGVLDALAPRFVDELGPELREAVEALAVARRATRRLLEAVLARAVSDEFIDELAELTFVTHTAEGLTLHDSVRLAVVTRLCAIDPERHRALRAAVVNFLDHAIDDAVPVGPEAWR